MRLRPPRISTPAFLYKIFPGRHYILIIWPRNCTTSAAAMSLTINQPKNNTHYGTSTNLSISRKPGLRMNRRRLRVKWIVIISLTKTNDFDSLDCNPYYNYQMSIVYINIFLAFTLSFMGLLIYRSHLISSLLCLEGMILSLFVIMTVTILVNHFTLASIAPIILLVFAACEAALGLSLLVIISNTYGTDYVQNLNLLQC